MITIIDYGMGNLGSIKNMFKKIGVQCIVSNKMEDMQMATKLLLPGVGSFDDAMKNLSKFGLTEIIKEKIIGQNTPILGICLGMQLLTNGSEEGIEKGLCAIDAYAKRFDFSNLETSLPVPHMGWNRTLLQKESKLFSNMPKNSRFYFVHSFAVDTQYKKDQLTITQYGYNFVSSFEYDNILGVQFHPEKSHKFGMQLLKNFAENY